MDALVLHRTPEPTPRPVLATLRDGRVEVWLVSDFDDVVAKADGDKVKPFRPPKIYHDSQGSFRWITLHPNGKGEKGVPVKIRESKTEPGTWHVVAGAGGKLNYARLSNIGSIEEQKERYYARQEQKKAAKVEADRADAERFDALSPDEQEAEQQTKRDLRQKKKTAQEKLEVEQREAIANVAKLLEWPEDEWSFEATRARLQAAKTPKERIEQLERAHLKRMMTKVKQVQRETRKRLLVDHEARAAAGLGEVPLRSDNPDEIALQDLDPDKPGKGKGFASGTGELSDRSILKEIASKDVERLQQEEQAARDDYDPEQPATRGRLEQIRAEHTIAAVCQEYAEKSDDEIAAAVVELEGERQDATMQLLDLRQRIEKQKGVVERTQDKDLKRLEKERLETLKAAVGGALEDRRAAQLKLDALAATQESGILAVKGERAKLSRQRQQEREQQLRAEGATEEDIENYRDRREAFLRAGEMYRAEIEARKLAGQIKVPEVDVKPIDDPKKAVELLRATKRIEQLAKAAEATDKAGSADDVEKLFGKGMYLDTSDIDRQVERDIRNDIAESSTRSFLSEVYSEDPTQAELLSLTEDQKREALQRHVGVGAFRALNTACLTILKEPALPRDVVDVLGTGGAAQLLAIAIHRGHDADELASIREGLEEYHLQNHLEQSEAAVATARDLYEQVRELELGAAANPADLATLQEINAQRRAKLLEARQALGETLGELESFAQLAVALRSKPASQIDVTLGPIAADAAIRQCRALGLGRDAYSIDFDGTNRYLRVNQSGIETLLSGNRVDPAELKQDAEVDAIKRGERDEPDWIPKGLISWPKSAFRVDPDLGPAPLTRGLKPPSGWGDGSDIATDIHAHVGARIANGEAPGDILPDLLTHISTLPEDRRPAALDVVDKLTPEQAVKDERGRTVFAKVPARDENGQVIYDAPDQPRMVTKVGEDGKPVPAMRRLHADAYRDHFRAVAEAYMAENYPDRKVAAFHAQGLNLEGDAGETTRKALYAALAADPRATAGFKAPGELSSTDRRSLRSYFDSHVAPAARGDEIDLDAEREKLRTLGDAPEEFSTDMFGTKTRSQEHAAWSEKRAAIMERINRGTLGWNQYVRQMGGVDRAYAALQDRLKGDLLERFHKSHAGMAGEPLRAGVVAIRETERHGAFVDPKRREEIRAKMEEIRQSLQQRKTKGQAGGGQFSGYLGQVTAVMQAEEKARQNQVSLFGGGGTSGTGVKAPRTKAEAHERFALGERVEAQVGQLLRERATENLSQRPDVQSKLFPGFSMSDAYVKQQRAVKMFATAKRINAALGTGSGKTPISIGAFTHVASDPKSGVKRGIWIVPSQVQGQFHGEMAQFVEPGKFNWHSKPGASHEERMSAHRDPDTHMVVMTHQGLRDDMAKLVGEHLGAKNEGELREKFMGLDRQQRAKLVGEVMGKHGMDYQAAFVDEGHILLDRDGKPDSLLSQMIQAITDNTSHFMSMSADPAKNDVSEIRSQLDKIYTDGRYGDPREWHKRYGLNTTASRDALKLEVGRRMIMGHIKPDVEARKRQESVPLSAAQSASYKRVLEVYDKARAARSAGKIDVEAIRELAPKEFAGAPAEKHEEIARRLAPSIGIIKEAALHRAVNLAKPESNAKLQKLREILKTHPTKEKPVVVFAHNLEAVDAIEKQLAADGHRVTALTGAHSGEEKDRRRRAFNPAKGETPTADVIVMSDAGATGLNLQRGQTLIQYDTPMTAMVHQQRNGRIHRLGQTRDVDLIDLVTDTPFEGRARERMARKMDLRDVFTDPGDAVDDTGLAGFISRARARKRLNDETPPLAA